MNIPAIRTSIVSSKIKANKGAIDTQRAQVGAKADTRDNPRPVLRKVKIPASSFSDELESTDHNVDIYLKTSNIAHAGTNCDMRGTLNFAVGGSEGRWILDNDGDDNERGDLDIYTVRINSIQDIESIDIAVRKSDDDDPRWHLAWVEVHDLATGAIYHGDYGQWIDPPAGNWKNVNIPLARVQ